MKANSVRVFWGLGVAIAVVALSSALWEGGPESVSPKELPPGAPVRGENVVAPVARTPMSRPAAESMKESIPLEDAPDMVSGLNASSGNIDQDLAIVSNLLETDFSVFQGYPMGGNVELMEAFTGANPRGIEFFSRDSKALDAQGRLVDR